MATEAQRGPVRRFAALSAAVVALIAAAVAVTIWRYEYALNQADVAIDARHDARLTAALDAIFWHEHEAMDEYFVRPSAASLREITEQRNLFAATSVTLGASQTAAESRFRLRATAANNSFYALFTA